MNLKKLANWSWNNSFFAQILLVLVPNYERTPVFVVENRGSLTDCTAVQISAPLFFCFSLPIPCQHHGVMKSNPFGTRDFSAFFQPGFVL
jgi:hypothetical protein